MISIIIVFVSFYLTIRVIMVELMQNLQNIYNKWEIRARPATSKYSQYQQNDRRYSNYTQVDKTYLKWFNKSDDKDRFNQRFNYHNRNRHKPSDEQLEWHSIANFKDSPSIMTENPLSRPYMGSSCPNCFPASRENFQNDPAITLGIRNILKVPTLNRENNVFTRTFHYASYALKMNLNYIYHDVSTKVLRSERVYQAIDKASEQEKEERRLSDEHLVFLHEKHKLRAKEIMLKLKSCVSTLLLRISAWVMLKLLSRMLNGIHIHKGQLEALKRVSQSKTPIIYLPLHRSHLDYILITFILGLNDLRVPLVAAGENLLIPIFGTLLRGLGAFFIKRKLDTRQGKKDFVYRALLHSYMSESLKNGHSLEFFIEGGRSRTGKSCLPKAGLLSVVVDSLAEGCINDAYIVPVAISYEKLMDGNFVSEQLGRSKMSESFPSAVQSIWKIMHSNYGNVRVDFCQPFSLKEYMNCVQKFSNKLPIPRVPSPQGSTCHSICPSYSNSSLYGSHAAGEDIRYTIKTLAEHVIYDASSSTALMSTNLLAFLLLTKHRKGATLPVLVQSFNWLREEISKRKRDVGFTGESADVIKHASNLLGKELISTETVQMEWSSGYTENNNLKIVFYKPSIRIPDVLELQYYSNSVLSVFLMESITANSLFALLNEEIDMWKGCDSKLVVSKQSLLSKAIELCDILQYEFVFGPPCSSLDVVISEVISQFISHGYLIVSEDNEQVGKKYKHSSNYAMTINYEDEDSDISEEFEDEQLKVNLDKDNVGALQFMQSILSPYIESYWLAACSLLKLVHAEKEETLFFKDMQKTAQDRLHQGLLFYEESFAAEPMKNAMKLFEHWNVLDSYQHNSLKIVYLGSKYDCEENVADVISRIEDFKK